MRHKTLSIRQLWDKTEEYPFKSNEYLDREVFAKLKKNLDSPKIDIIYGPRQSGKTTILMFLIDHLNDSGVDAGHIWYINLDLISDYSLFESAEKFLYLYDKSQVEGKLYLFIDEIQRLSAPGLFLKGIYDSRRDIKVIISGSASFAIKAKIKEFLTGRKRLHLVLPLSFREIVKAKGVIPAGLYEQKINRDNIAEWIKADEVFQKYLGILRDTFIISLLPPFTSNKRSEIKYSNKIYFNDPGIMNWTQKKMSPTAGRPDVGSVMENMVFIEMQKNLGLLDDIYYWRTKSKAEVDFVYSGKDRITPIEVKTGSAAIGTLTRSFHSFIETHNPPMAIFLNKDKFAHFRVNQTDVYYIPLHWFLLAGSPPF